MINSFDDAGVAGKEFVDSTLRSYAAVTKGLQAIATEAADYSKKAFEANSAAVEDLLSVKSLDRAFEVQGGHARRAYEAFVAEASRISELYADLAKEAYRPFERSLARAGASRAAPAPEA
jgi:hypothetical protein